MNGNGNTASGGGGGGVSISGNTTFTMSDGTISGNTASTYGGGVYVYGRGTFLKTNAGIIYGSNAPSGLRNRAGGNGDAVYVDTSPTKVRDSTVSATEALDSSSTDGWEGRGREAGKDGI
ncbi:hypothetical protein FACS1894200_05500 [Spirochaetia bacterium]|nr:hypothetical protein FACS1894200_05500 [Spirochaetia bacterium]